jgi:hypothetical protein
MQAGRKHSYTCLVLIVYRILLNPLTCGTEIGDALIGFALGRARVAVEVVATDIRKKRGAGNKG